MKNVKNLAALLCASAIVLGLSACKCDDCDDSKDANASVVSTEKATCADKAKSGCCSGAAKAECPAKNAQ